MSVKNFVLITIDCLRFDRVSWGMDADSLAETLTPNIDALTKEGVFFSEINSGGCWTQATFPVLFTSTYPSMYNGCLGPLASERPNLIRSLRRQGYDTLAVLSSPLLGKDYGYDQGFNTFVELVPKREPPDWFHWKGAQRLLRSSFFKRILMQAGVETLPAPAYALADEVTDRAIELVTSARTPFFLWLHYMDAHWPYYLESELSTAKQIAEAWNDRYLAGLASHKRGAKYPGDERLRRWTTMYDASIKRIDDQLGRLLDTLDVLAPNSTCVIVTADHGEEFFEHGNFGHGAGSLYQEIVHVPLVMSWPSGPRNSRISFPRSLIDIAPTILDLAGYPRPDTMLGDSLLPLTNEESSVSVESRPIISEGWWGSDAHIVSILAQGYKFIANVARPEQYELYDLREDPGETQNLRGEWPEKTEYFRELLKQHLAAVRKTKNELGATPESSEEVLKRLRALGYVD